MKWNPSFHLLQNSPYFCVFKYARAVKQKVWNKAENARKSLTPRFTNFFTDFEKKKPTVLRSKASTASLRNAVRLQFLSSAFVCSVQVAKIIMVEDICNETFANAPWGCAAESYLCNINTCCVMVAVFLLGCMVYSPCKFSGHIS